MKETEIIKTSLINFLPMHKKIRDLFLLLFLSTPLILTPSLLCWIEEASKMKN